MKILKEFGRNPQADWTVILTVSVLLAAGLAIMGLNLYNAVTQGRIAEEVAKRTSFSKPNEKVISAALETYATKAEISGKARAGYTGAPDPSI